LQTIAASLRQWGAFSHFNDEDLSSLARCVSRTRLPSGATVVQQNDLTFDAYLIEQGQVRIERKTSYGCYLLATLGPGEIFGEASYIDNLGRSSDAVTVGQVDLLVFNPVALSTLTERDRRFDLALHWVFWKSLSDKLRNANEHLVHFFTQGEVTTTAERIQVRPATDSFQLDLATKRQVFEEQKLSAMEIRFLTSLSKEKKFAAGELIFQEGEVGDGMYVVVEGQVRISKNIPGAGEEALAILERGDYFGEMALIDNRPRSADARAHTEGVVVLAIPRDVVEGVLDIRSKVSSLRLLKLLCSLVTKRLREIDEKIVGWFMLSGGNAVSG